MSVELFTTSGKSIRFHVNAHALLWRAKTLFTKEPETIRWLDTLGPRDVLYDVGANVGMYTIYAAALGAQVQAFEPEALNFAALAKNVVLNDLGHIATIWPIALSEGFGYAQMYLSEFSTGGSCHSYGKEVGFDLKPRPAKYRQGVHAAQLDDLVYKRGLPMPTHIKIDVDGFEHFVLAGGRAVLGDPRVRGVCVELNPNIPQHVYWATCLVDHYDYKLDPEQVARSTRTEGAFKGVAEHVFHR